jgi:hypothetical protein
MQRGLPLAKRDATKRRPLAGFSYSITWLAKIICKKSAHPESDLGFAASKKIFITDANYLKLVDAPSTLACSDSSCHA